MNLQTAFEKSLSAPDPASALRTRILEFAKQGQSKAAIYDALEALVLSLRAKAGNEAAVELVLDVMDALTGACHPDARLLAEETR
jgi:hypothetical protein